MIQRDVEMMGVRTERVYANTTRNVAERLREVARVNRWTLSRTVHVMLVIGLSAYEQELERSRSEAEAEQ